jgi:hypothetical protein
VRLGEEARREASARVADSERLADEMLADARAVSAGLRQLGSTLQDQAERILRDVQAGHKRIRGDLRTVSGGGSSSSASDDRPSRSRRGGPFDDLEVPSWAEGPGSGS